MSIAPAETVIERPETQPPSIRPTAHWWHSSPECQGKQPGPKVCYCGAKITTNGQIDSWTGKVIAEDCVVCLDFIEASHCPICGEKK